MERFDTRSLTEYLNALEQKTSKYTQEENMGGNNQTQGWNQPSRSKRELHKESTKLWDGTLRKSKR